MSELLLKLNHKNLQGSSKSKQQEMRDYLEIIKIERKNYIEKRMIIDMISVCVHETDLTEDLKNKVRSILLSVEVNPCMDLKTALSEEKLFGLSDLGNTELSFNEQEELNHVLQNKLQCQRKGIINDTNEQDEMLHSFDLCNLTVEDKKLINERDKLNDIQGKYMKNLEYMYDLLQDLLQLRFTKSKELIGNKLDEYALKSKMYHLRTEMIKEKTKIDFFNETQVSRQAYKELFNNITEQQEHCQKEIKDLSALNEKYKLVVCKEYNEILKSYLQYKESVEKKKDLYKQLKER